MKETLNSHQELLSEFLRELAELRRGVEEHLEVVSVINHHGGDGKRDCRRLRLLSPRESEILKQIADGKNVKEIADELRISVKTVETHRQHIKEKLGLFTIAELTKFAIRAGLPSL